jgi:hypothetical protein
MARYDKGASAVCNKKKQRQHPSISALGFLIFQIHIFFLRWKKDSIR